MIKPVQIIRTNIKLIQPKLRTKALKKEFVPYVASPLLVYWTDKKNAKIRKGTIDDEMIKSKDLHSSHHPVTDNTNKSEKILEQNGVSKSDLNKYINKDGTLNQKGKNISHKGSPNDNINLEEDFSPELQADLDEIEDLVPELDPELKEVLYAPPIDTPEGLIETIFGELPEGADIDWDLWDLLKEMADEILDFGDIF